jgi:hypothetical protein
MTSTEHDLPGHRFIAMADGTFVGPTKHRYRQDDEVRTPEWGGMSTIIGLIPDREAYERENGPVSGTGPLYVVNEGAVFGHGGRFEKVYSESDLEPSVIGEPEFAHRG